MIRLSDLESLAQRLDALQVPSGDIEAPRESTSVEALAQQAESLRALRGRLGTTVEQMAALTEAVDEAVAALEEAQEEWAVEQRSEWVRLLAPEPSAALRQERDTRLAAMGLRSAGWYDPEFGQVRLAIAMHHRGDTTAAAEERELVAGGIAALGEVLVEQEHDEDGVAYQVYSIPGAENDPDEEIEFWVCAEPEGDRLGDHYHVISRLFGIPRVLASFDGLDSALAHVQQNFATHPERIGMAVGEEPARSASAS